MLETLVLKPFIYLRSINKTRENNKREALSLAFGIREFHQSNL